MAAQSAKTQYVEAGNGVKFAYRVLGNSSEIPLVLHSHFRSNMDYWVSLMELATFRFRDGNARISKRKIANHCS
jgi:hypothetical protein